jgi:hypothetical protein
LTVLDRRGRLDAGVHEIEKPVGFGSTSAKCLNVGCLENPPCQDVRTVYEEDKLVALMVLIYVMTFGIIRLFTVVIETLGAT